MPLQKSGSKAAFAANMHELKNSGYPQKQRLAIALDVQRRAEKPKAKRASPGLGKDSSRPWGPEVSKRRKAHYF